MVPCSTNDGSKSSIFDLKKLNIENSKVENLRFPKQAQKSTSVLNEKLGLFGESLSIAMVLFRVEWDGIEWDQIK